MGISELLDNMSRSLGRLWDWLAFVFRTYTKTALVVLVLLTTGTVVWARSGFSLSLFRSFAAEQPENPDGGGGGGGTGDQGGGGGGGTTPSPTIAPGGQQSTPHAYCDFATNSCLMKATNDYNAPQCSAAGTACTPGQCRTWTGSDETSWKPNTGPAGQPACESLSKIDSTVFPSLRSQVPVPPPITFPSCFVFEDRSSSDPNWGTMTENTVPGVLQNNPTAKLTYKAYVVNNCPWAVHMVFQVDGSKKAGFQQGVGKRSFYLSDAEANKSFTVSSPDGNDIPSCWNSGRTGRPADCAREVSIDYNLNAYTCGSLGVSIAWWHQVGGSQHKTDPQGGTGIASALNYGKDCTGGPLERAPGNGGGTTPPGGSTTCTAAPKPSKLTVQCGTTQNVLTWTKETNTCANSVLKSIDGGNASFVVDKTITLTTTTWTDKSVQPNHVYKYQVKNHPNVISNAVSCANGVQVSISPVPTSSVKPSATPAQTATVLPSASVSPGTSVLPTDSTTPTPDGDLDNDGVPNGTECPGYVNSDDISGCVDTDGDTVPDILDVDSDNDGIPDGQDPNRLVVSTPRPGTSVGPGGVQTGPGEATLLALIVSAVISLAYVSYTYSPSGRRKEAETVSKDQGPMDFRS